MPETIFLGVMSAFIALMSVRLKLSFKDKDEQTREAVDAVSWYGLQFSWLFYIIAITQT